MVTIISRPSKKVIKKMSVLELRCIEFDKTTSTNLVYFQTNDKQSFEIIINFLATVDTFHKRKSNELLAQYNEEQLEELEIEKNNRMLQKFEVETVHRYLNTILLDGEYNRETNIAMMLEFYKNLANKEPQTIQNIETFAKQMPIITDTFSSVNMDEESYNKIMNLFIGDSYLSHLGFNQAIILSSQLLSRLRSLLGCDPSPTNLFMYYLGTRFS